MRGSMPSAQPASVRTMMAPMPSPPPPIGMPKPPPPPPPRRSSTLSELLKSSQRMGSSLRGGRVARGQASRRLRLVKLVLPRRVPARGAPASSRPGFFVERAAKRAEVAPGEPLLQRAAQEVGRVERRERADVAPRPVGEPASAAAQDALLDAEELARRGAAEADQ